MRGVRGLAAAHWPGGARCRRCPAPQPKGSMKRLQANCHMLNSSASKQVQGAPGLMQCGVAKRSV